MSFSDTAQKAKSRLGFLTEMRRYPDQGWVAGVCAGIADYFGWKLRLVRLVTFLLLIFTAGSVIVVAYIALWFLMDAGDINDPNRPRYEQDLATAIATAAAATEPVPASSSREIRERFTLLDARLRRMEEAALSKDVALARELEKLEREHRSSQS